MTHTTRTIVGGLLIGGLALANTACQSSAAPAATAASGYVEATDVRVAAKVAGRVATVTVNEGQTVQAGQTLVTIDTKDTDLAIARAQAERAQAVAQLRLVQAGSRVEDIQQAEAQQAAAESDRKAAEDDLAAAKADEARFEQLLAAKSGSQKQRDDAVTRRQLAESRVRGANDRIRAAAALVARLKAGARPEEVETAKTRIAAVDAQIVTLQNDLKEATVVAPSGGTVTSRLVEPGELASRGTPLVVIIDLAHAWANVYVPEAMVPTVKIDGAVTIRTDAGDTLSGKVAYVSPQAEFTPRNVQTANERAKLVYRVKVLVNNDKGVLKPGMSVTADFGAAR